MGKTRLAARFAARGARGRRGRACTGAIDEEPSSRYQPFVEALRHSSRTPAAVTGPADLEALARWSPSWAASPRSSGASARGPPLPAVRGCRRAARPRRRRRPLLLVLDDLHWADMPTLLLLRHLVRRLDAGALLVLVHDARRGGQPRRRPAAAARRPAAASTRSSGSRSRGPGGGETPRELVARDPGSRRRVLHCARDRGQPVLHRGDAAQPRPRAPEAEARARGRQGPDLAPPRAARAARPVEALTAGRGARPRLRPRHARGDGAAAGRSCSTRSRRRCAPALVREDAEQVDRFAFAHALVRETLYDAPADAAPRAPAPARRPRRSRRARRRRPAELAHHFFAAREVGGAEAAVEYSAAAAAQAVAAHAYEEAAWHLAAGARGRPAAPTSSSRSATCAGRPASPAPAPRSTRPSRSPATP